MSLKSVLQVIFDKTFLPFCCKNIFGYRNGVEVSARNRFGPKIEVGDEKQLLLFDRKRLYTKATEKYFSILDKYGDL